MTTEQEVLANVLTRAAREPDLRNQLLNDPGNANSTLGLGLTKGQVAAFQLGKDNGNDVPFRMQLASLDTVIRIWAELLASKVGDSEPHPAPNCFPGCSPNIIASLQ